VPLSPSRWSPAWPGDWHGRGAWTLIPRPSAAPCRSWRPGQPAARWQCQAGESALGPWVQAPWAGSGREAMAGGPQRGCSACRWVHQTPASASPGFATIDGTSGVSKHGAPAPRAATLFGEPTSESTRDAAKRQLQRASKFAQPRLSRCAPSSDATLWDRPAAGRCGRRQSQAHSGSVLPTATLGGGCRSFTPRWQALCTEGAFTPPSWRLLAMPVRPLATGIALGSSSPPRSNPAGAVRPYIWSPFARTRGSTALSGPSVPQRQLGVSGLGSTLLSRLPMSASCARSLFDRRDG
jgi:hypothetical protein